MWSHGPRMETRRVRPRRATYVPLGSLNNFLQAGIQVAFEYASARRIPHLVTWVRRNFGLGGLLIALVETIYHGVPSPDTGRNWRRFWAWRRALSIAYYALEDESRHVERPGHPQSLLGHFEGPDAQF